MKLKHLILIAFAVIANAMFSACGSDTPVIPEVTIAENSMNYFVEPMDFPSSGGAKILNFTTNVDWTLTVMSTQNGTSWCAVSQNEGKAGSFGLAIMVEENEGYDDRNTVLVLQAGNITKNVIINQKSKNSITLTTNRFEVGPMGGVIDVEVKSNVDYSIEIPDYCQKWISKTSNSRALSAKNISFDISESEEYDKREGEIIFKSNDITEKVKIYQAGSAILVLSKNEYTLDCGGGTVSIDISSNFIFEIDMPNVDWVKLENNNRAVSSHTVLCTIDENSTFNDREATIVFIDPRSSKKESVTIKQRQKDAIILSKEKVEIPQEGGEFSIEVNSNINYSVEINPSCSTWISSLGETRSLTNSKRSFKVLGNEEYDKREGEIYFKYGNVTETLKVYQSGGSILVLTKDSYSLEGNATTISVELKSNISYTVSTSSDWITEEVTRAISSSTKRFKIDRNKTGESRNGKITFTTIDGKKTAQVSIAQASLIEAKSLKINFSNTSGTAGGNLYIGKDYKFTVTASPNNAIADYEWKVEDANIALIFGQGEYATLSTKNFGKTKVVVTEKNTGISESYEFGTCVTDFMFKETSRETQYGYPIIKIALGGQYELKYDYTPSYAKNIFSELRAFNFKEIDSSVGSYVIVEKSSIIDIDPNGIMTAKKIGKTIIEANNGYGVYKNGSNSGIFVEVVKELTPYGTIGGHGYVDLGLPSGKLWATENFGASNATSYGSYYMWSSSDRVPTSWGAKWSTPTNAEFKELLDNCSYEWTTKNGVNGYLFTGKNGATMFLPAAGFKIYVEGYGYSEVQSGGKSLMYWSSVKSSYTWEGHAFAYVLQGSSSSLSANETYNTSVCAAPIRPIAR